MQAVWLKPIPEGDDERAVSFTSNTVAVAPAGTVASRPAPSLSALNEDDD